MSNAFSRKEKELDLNFDIDLNCDFEDLINSGSELENSYNFENYYTDSLNCYDSLDDIFYTGDSPFIIIKDHKWFHNGKFEKVLFYTIKIRNNKFHNGKYEKSITYRELFNQLDFQSVEYLDVLLNDDHRFIETIVKKNGITYELWCGS